MTYIKRRNFVKSVGLASIGAPILLKGMKFQTIAKEYFTTPKALEDRVLILIRMNGGNDGLHTVIPRDQYANLALQRPNIILPETSILPLTTEVGLHPIMTGMKTLFDTNKMGIVQNVGYPQQNRSHFRSMDIWTTGMMDQSVTTGWLGRNFDLQYPNYPAAYPDAANPDPFAISMGYEVSATCQGLEANFSHALNDPFDTTVLDPSSVVNDGTYYGDHMAFLANLISQTNAYGTQINDAANAGSTLSTLYDNTNSLAVQLRFIAQMISGGLKTKVYIINHNGFDTHDAQTDQADHTIGDHANLLKKLSDAVTAFQDDLQLLGLESRVAGMTFSEFGRQVASNASYGTDHGDAAPLFLFGTCLNQQIVGPNPQINSAIVDQEGVPMQIDFRDVYASLLKDWFGVSTTAIQSLFEQTVTFYSLMNSCNLVGVDENTLDKPQLLIYPNPCYSGTTIRFESDNEFVRIEVYSMDGKKVLAPVTKDLYKQQHDIYIETIDLPVGEYIVKILKQSGSLEAKLIKLRN